MRRASLHGNPYMCIYTTTQYSLRVGWGQYATGRRSTNNAAASQLLTVVMSCQCIVHFICLFFFYFNCRTVRWHVCMSFSLCSTLAGASMLTNATLCHSCYADLHPCHLRHLNPCISCSCRSEENPSSWLLHGQQQEQQPPTQHQLVHPVMYSMCLTQPVLGLCISTGTSSGPRGCTRLPHYTALVSSAVVANSFICFLVSLG